MNSQCTAIARQLLLVAGILLANGSAIGAVPATMTYQGQLTNSSGSPVNSTVPMVFRLYNVATGGSALWEEPQSVSVSSGYFNVELGSVTAFPAGLFDTPLYLGVTVGTDTEMTPRRALSSTGYAFKAKESASLQMTENEVTIYRTHAMCVLSGRTANLTFDSTCPAVAEGCGSYNYTCGVFCSNTAYYFKACDGTCTTLSTQPGYGPGPVCNNPPATTFKKQP